MRPKFTLRNHRLSISQLRLIQFVLLIGFFVRSIALMLINWQKADASDMLGFVNLFIIAVCFAITMRDPKDC